MDTLNTDCLLEIIKFLNLKDQLLLHQVSCHLQMAVATFWQIKYKSLHINFLELPLTSQEFRLLMRNIRDVVEELQLRFLTQDKYDVLKEFCFTRVHNFRFTLHKPYFLEDNDIKDLKTILPNLKAFSPHGNLSGLHMDEWPMLKELNLSFCFRLEMLHFQTIMRQLKLQKLKLNIFPNSNQFEHMNLQEAQLENLKYLELNTYEFYYFLSKPLTALKELIITNHYNPRQLFDVLLSVWQANQIVLVETANVDNILVNCLEMHMNVEQLTIVNDENPLPSHIVPLLHTLTDLRKLHFINCNIRSIDFLNLLQNIPQLLEISFDNCHFDAANICLKVEDVIVKRQHKLRLNMFENRFTDNSNRPVWFRMNETAYVVVDLIGENKLFELTHLKGDDLCYEPLYVVYR